VDRTRPPTVATAADELYAGPLEGFVDRRRVLARTLRDGGDATGSKQLEAMAKPSITAWAVNQLWWVHRDAFDALLAAARALQRSPDAQAEFDRRMRAARDLGREVLSGAGHPTGLGALRPIATTLHAIAAAGSFAPDAPGRLTADRESLGFEAMEGAEWPARAADGPPVATAAGRRAARTPRTPAESRQAKRDADAKRTAQRTTEATREAEKKAFAKLQRDRADAQRAVDRHAADIARADRDLAALAARQAELDVQRQRIEKEKARADGEVDRARQHLVAIERALRAARPQS